LLGEPATLALVIAAARLFLLETAAPLLELVRFLFAAALLLGDPARFLGLAAALILLAAQARLHLLADLLLAALALRPHARLIAHALLRIAPLILVVAADLGEIGPLSVRRQV